MPDALQAGGSGAEIGVSADPRREAAPALCDSIAPLERLLASLPADHPGLDAARAAIASLGGFDDVIQSARQRFSATINA